ncbi:MAG TPA: radical SAM protein [Ktedonobacteraceae bacterium]
MKILLILVAMPEMKPIASIPYPIMAPPITLLLLAEICRRAGYEAELIDTRFYMSQQENEWVLNDNLLERAIAQSDAEIAGISFLSSSAQEGFRVAAYCKKYQKTVIGGGLHASVALEEFLRSNGFHYVIQGDAEEVFTSLLANLIQGSAERYPDTMHVLQAKSLRNLQTVPPVTDFSPYQRIFEQYSTYRAIYIETSRGCFKQCHFCEVARTGAAWKPFRKFPLETAFTSIEAAVSQYQINYVLIADSIATFFKAHFLEFARQMAKKFPEITTQFNSTVDCWNEEIAQACASLRCSVWFGFESGSQRVLDQIIQKGTTVEQAYEAARLCRKYAIPCGFNVLLGLPGETEEDYKLTLEFFEQLPWVHPSPNIFNPLPGTVLYDFSIEQGLLRKTEDYSIWDPERIARTGRGPIDGVDYALALQYYHKYMEMQKEAERSLTRAN